MSEAHLGEEREAGIRRGAHNAVFSCLGVNPKDRVFVLTDRATEHIGRALCDEAAKVASCQLKLLEEYGPRPLASFPEPLRNLLEKERPTVTFFAAQGQPGEIRFRRPFLDYLVQDLRVRHGHMINIDDHLMLEGMVCDYHQIAAVTTRVYEICRSAQEISVTSDRGTNVTARFSPNLRWIPCTGIYHEQGQWGNLPEGETYTCPERVDGVFVGDLVGDYFSEKYGLLDQPVTIQITNSRATSVRCANRELERDLWDYFQSAESGNRVGEFAIGTNVCLKHLTGNLLQDEKFPAVHMAFGNPYPFETGADWSSEVHVDIITLGCSIVADGQTIMRNGKFEERFLEGQT